MISKIRLENFKCFASLFCELGKATVLAGLNGSGKSSLIQALLCTRGIADRVIRDEPPQIDIGGGPIDMGNVRDLAYRFRSVDRLSCELESDADGCFGWSFDYRMEDAELNVVPVDVPDGQKPLAEKTAAMRYLSANRKAPASSHRFSESDARRGNLGDQGEHVASCLAVNGGKTVAPAFVITDRLAPEEHYDTLLEQTNVWLRKFSPTAYVMAKKSADGLRVDLRFGFGDRKPESAYRPENVGVGLSIALPLIVMLLSAKAGDVLLIENPEADLHPKGQAYVAELIARATRAGVQVIVETHSDHIINGLRVAVKRGLCSVSDVKLLFFKRQTNCPLENGPIGWQVSTAEEITIGPQGDLSNFPKDLLEQWMIHSDELMTIEAEADESDESSAES